MPEVEPFSPYLHHNGPPFEPLQFTCWFRRAALAAGLAKGRTVHGLRKAAGRRVAEAECSDSYIEAVSGHKDPREVAHYRRNAEQAGRAREAMTLARARFKSGPANTVETFFGNPDGNHLAKKA